MKFCVGINSTYNKLIISGSAKFAIKPIIFLTITYSFEYCNKFVQLLHIWSWNKSSKFKNKFWFSKFSKISAFLAFD